MLHRVIAAAILLFASCAPAAAHYHHHHHYRTLSFVHHHAHISRPPRENLFQVSETSIRITKRPPHADFRPRAWCGWYARHYLVSRDPGPRFDLACNWLSYGRPAAGPAIGALVVWCSGRHHHVGKIVGEAGRGLWLVMSGNDGHSVRTRPRSVAGAIAFRWP